MAGDENISMQEAEGGGDATGGIKKGKRTGAASGRTVVNGSGRRWRGRTVDWRRTRRAGAELIDEASGS
jgi:hypothetical protein